MTLDGALWFVAADAADVLGFTTTAGAGWYARHLREDERSTITLSDGKRGNPRKTIISESGLYKLALRSDKPEARPLQDWVTKVVLPTIRKEGAYVMGEEKITQPNATVEDLDTLNDRKRGVEARLPLRAVNVLGRPVAGSFEPALWSTLTTARRLVGIGGSRF